MPSTNRERKRFQSNGGPCGFTDSVCKLVVAYKEKENGPSWRQSLGREDSEEFGACKHVESACQSDSGTAQTFASCQA